MGLYLVFKWLFVSDQTALQSETLTTTPMVQNHMAGGDIYKIVSGWPPTHEEHTMK